VTTPDLLDQLLQTGDPQEQRLFLEEHRALLHDDLAAALKREADRALRADCRRSLQLAALLELVGVVGGDPCHRALGLRSEGNCRCLGGLGEYERAVELYDEAAEIYRAAGDPLQWASSQIGKLWDLANLGRYEHAMETYRAVAGVFEEHGEWHALGAVTLNMGMMAFRMGRDAESLALDGYLSRGIERDSREIALFWYLLF
jgi:tetratricopeptide (TPR) repeat protein